MRLARFGLHARSTTLTLVSVSAVLMLTAFGIALFDSSAAMYRSIVPATS